MFKSKGRTIGYALHHREMSYDEADRKLRILANQRTLHERAHLRAEDFSGEISQVSSQNVLVITTLAKKNY